MSSQNSLQVFPLKKTLDKVSEHDMSSYPVDAPNVSRQTIRFPSALDTTPRLSDHDPSRWA